jgi:hypothetical protein
MSERALPFIYLCARHGRYLGGWKSLRQPGHREPSEPQGRDREGASEGSGERSRRPMNKNRIRGVDDQGERANDREALVAKGRRRRSDGRARKGDVLTRGDLDSCLKGRRL